MVMAGGLVVAIRKLYQWAPDDGFEKLVLAFLLVSGAAYLSHLALVTHITAVDFLPKFLDEL